MGAMSDGTLKSNFNRAIHHDQHISYYGGLNSHSIVDTFLSNCFLETSVPSTMIWTECESFVCLSRSIFTSVRSVSITVKKNAYACLLDIWMPSLEILRWGLGFNCGENIEIGAHLVLSAFVVSIATPTLERRGVSRSLPKTQVILQK